MVSRMSNTATHTFTLLTRTEAGDTDIWTAVDHEGCVWTAVLGADGRDTIITPTGGHVAPEQASYSGTHAFVAFIIEQAS